MGYVRIQYTVMQKNILVFDSGLGGLTVLLHLQKLLPHERFLYVADNAHMPYGKFSTDQVKCFVVESIRRVVARMPIKMIVFACNTATNCASSTVREMFGVPVVCIEPALKLGAGYTCVVAFITHTTYMQKKYQELRAKYPPIAECASALLAEWIEKYIQTGDIEYHTRILQTLGPYQVYKPDAVVLGCTHYPLIKKIFQKKFPNACLLDGGLGTAKQAVRVLERVEKRTKGRGKVTFVCTKGWFYKQTLKKLYKRIKKEL